MKRFLSAIICLTMVLSLTVFAFPAYAVNEGDFEYEIIDGGAQITAYNGTDTDVVIPSELDGYVITDISSYAFYGFDTIESIVIPDSIVSIGDGAFGGTGIESVTIPDSVTYLGDYAFDGCSDLEEITVGDNLEYIGGGIANGTAWLSAKPEGVVYLEKYAIGYIGDAPVGSYFDIVDGTKGIAAEAFSFQENITTPYLPESLEFIGDSAFSGCTSLEFVVLPSYITEIAPYTFSDSGITTIGIPDGLTAIQEGAFSGCVNLPDVFIPDSVEYIGPYAFSGCISLMNVAVAESNLTEIAEGAFEYCSSIESIYIPDKVTTIGSGAFAYCTALTEFGFPPDIEVISNAVLMGCESLELLGMNTPTAIGAYAFADCVSLIDAGMSQTVESIGYGAYSGCKSIQNIYLPPSLAIIGDEAFRGCISLEEFFVDSIESDYYYAENGVLLSKDGSYLIAYPAAKTDTGYNIPYTVTTICNSAFAFAANLEAVDIPDGVEDIGASAFESSGLTSVAIPSTVTEIGAAAFMSTALTTVTIPASVEKIGEFAFNMCDMLTSITVNSQNPNYSALNGVLFDKKFTCLIQYPAAKTGTEYTIPNGVQFIESYAFEGSVLETVSIPDTVEYFDGSAFFKCQSLTDINIVGNARYNVADGVVFDYIDGYLVYYPMSKTDEAYAVPEYVSSIGFAAFAGNPNIKEVYLNEYIYYIDTYAFSFCENLEKAVFLSGCGFSDVFAESPNVTVYGLNGSDTDFCAWWNDINFVAIDLYDEESFVSVYSPEGYPFEEGVELEVSLLDELPAGFNNSAVGYSIELVRDGLPYTSEHLVRIKMYNPFMVYDYDDELIIPNVYYIDGEGNKTEAVYSSDGEFIFIDTDTLGTFVIEGDSMIIIETGDVDLSGGSPTISDALLLFKHVAGVALLTEEDAINAADVDYSGEITIADALVLFKFVAGVISEL